MKRMRPSMRGMQLLANLAAHGASGTHPGCFRRFLYFVLLPVLPVLPCLRVPAQLMHPAARSD
jgi:hypothetical protein